MVWFYCTTLLTRMCTCIQSCTIFFGLVFYTATVFPLYSPEQNHFIWFYCTALLVLHSTVLNNICWFGFLYWTAGSVCVQSCLVWFYWYCTGSSTRLHFWTILFGLVLLYRAENFRNQWLIYSFILICRLI